MPRCQYPRCERIVREPNKYGLCHVHLEMAEFFLWFGATLQRMERLADTGPAEGATVRPSGLVVPPH